MADNDRPQDVGRRHSRKRSEADSALIDRWQAELRLVLDRCIIELQGEAQPDGLHGPVPRKMPSIAVATDVVKLGALVSRELGGAIDPAPVGRAQTADKARPGRRRVPYE